MPRAVIGPRNIDLRDHHNLPPLAASFDEYPHHCNEFCTLVPLSKTHHCDGNLWVSGVQVLAWGGLDLQKLLQ